MSRRPVRKLTPAQAAAAREFGPLDGARIPGGCDRCDAYQTMSPASAGMWALTVQRRRLPGARHAPAGAGVMTAHLRTLADVAARARRHAIRTSHTTCTWGPALRLTPCPCCGDGSAIAEHDGVGVIAHGMACGGDVAEALVREPGPDLEALVDQLIDALFILVRHAARTPAPLCKDEAA